MILLRLIDGFFYVYMIMLTMNILSSWFHELQQFRIVQMNRALTDPYLSIFRRFIPPLGPIDISPIIAFFSLEIIKAVVKGVLFP
jgi:YggT family protein